LVAQAIAGAAVNGDLVRASEKAECVEAVINGYGDEEVP
jgi:hypothetical protein